MSADPAVLQAFDALLAEMPIILWTKEINLRYDRSARAGRYKTYHLGLSLATRRWQTHVKQPPTSTGHRKRQLVLVNL